MSIVTDPHRFSLQSLRVNRPRVNTDSVSGLDDFNLDRTSDRDRDRTLDLDRPYDPLDEPIASYSAYPAPNRVGWVIGIIVSLAIAGAGGYMYWKQREPPVTLTRPAPAAPKPAAEQPATQPAVVGENIPLPPLAESDSLIRELVGRLSSHPAVASWLATKGLLTNFVVVTQNISEGHLPTSQLHSIAPKEPFRAAGSG